MTQTLQKTDGDTRLRLLLAGGAVVWVLLWLANERVWDGLVALLGLDLESRAVGAVHFFFYDTVKIFLLLLGLMFVVGMLRASLDLERARTFLEGRGLFVGLVLAVVLGVVTPFCSCSSIPLFIGFVAAGIPLSVTLTFLIASPLVSEIAAIPTLLYSLPLEPAPLLGSSRSMPAPISPMLAMPAITTSVRPTV